MIKLSMTRHSKGWKYNIYIYSCICLHQTTYFPPTNSCLFQDLTIRVYTLVSLLAVLSAQDICNSE